MRRLVRPEGFVAVINMYTSFGNFEDDDENPLVAENIHRSLRPGGVALIETVGKEVIARDWRQRWWTEVDGVLRHNRWDQGRWSVRYGR